MHQLLVLRKKWVGPLQDRGPELIESAVIVCENLHIKKGLSLIMGRPLRIESPGAFYHVTSRGNERNAVFKSLRDREKFLSYLESATERCGAIVHVYCLMDNRYHLLVETPLGNLSKIM